MFTVDWTETRYYTAHVYRHLCPVRHIRRPGLLFRPCFRPSRTFLRRREWCCEPRLYCSIMLKSDFVTINIVDKLLLLWQVAGFVSGDLIECVIYDHDNRQIIAGQRSVFKITLSTDTRRSCLGKCRWSAASCHIEVILASSHFLVTIFNLHCHSINYCDDRLTTLSKRINVANYRHKQQLEILFRSFAMHSCSSA